MSTLTLLPLDLTGNQLSNRRSGEEHTLITVMGKTDRLLVPQFGGFYEKHLKVYNDNNQVLTKGVDYTVNYLYRQLSELTGKAVYGMVVIINPAVSAKVTVDYRAVGGPFGLSVEELQTVLDELSIENRPFTWEDIVGKPREYPPESHSHKFWQLYGMNNAITAMTDVSDAIAMDREYAYQHDVDYADAYYDLAVTRTEQYGDAFNQHVARRDNPHQTNKDQIELGMVEDYPLATLTEAQDGERNDRYMSVARTYQALSTQLLPELTDHLSDTENPHEVTAAQLQTYTTGETNNIINMKQRRDQPVYDSSLLGGRDYDTLYSEVRTNLPANAFVGVVDPERLGSGTPTSTTVLNGGQWVNADTLFETYSPPSTKVLYIGWLTNDSNALTVINATYNDVNEYPVGTVIFYTVRYRTTTYGANGAYEFTMVQLSAAVRTASGWINN